MDSQDNKEYGEQDLQIGQLCPLSDAAYHYITRGLTIEGIWIIHFNGCIIYHSKNNHILFHVESFSDN